jgi:hypothetical protein
MLCLLHFLFGMLCLLLLFFYSPVVFVLFNAALATLNFYSAVLLLVFAVMLCPLHVFSWCCARRFCYLTVHYARPTAPIYAMLSPLLIFNNVMLDLLF